MTRKPVLWAWPALLWLLLLVLLPGCLADPTPIAENTEPPPPYAELYAGAERRIGTLDRLWASSVTSIRYVDAEGDRHRDQGEGHFQMQRPGSLAVFIGKLGETYLVLGSDRDRFWWIELLEERVAYVGQSSEALRSSESALGVPVLPSDLMLALDLERWPEPGSPRVLGVAWSSLEGLDPTRTAAVSIDEEGRTRRVHVDIYSLDPLAVELITPGGEVFAESRLTRHGRVLNRVGAPIEPRIPMRADVLLPAAEAELEISLSRAAMDPRRPKPVVFDFDALVSRFRVETVNEIKPPVEHADRDL